MSESSSLPGAGPPVVTTRNVVARTFRPNAIPPQIVVLPPIEVRPSRSFTFCEPAVQNGTGVEPAASTKLKRPARSAFHVCAAVRQRSTQAWSLPASQSIA